MGEYPEENRILVDSTITISEADYCYGTGPLTLRLARSVDLDQHPQIEWITISGTEILWNGNDGPTRSVLVRMAALRKAYKSQPPTVERGTAMEKESDASHVVRHFTLEIPVEMDTSSDAQEVVDKVADSLSFLQSLEYLRGLRFRQATLTERT
jgi:hypothetical protein